MRSLGAMIELSVASSGNCHWTADVAISPTAYSTAIAPPDFPAAKKREMLMTTIRKIAFIGTAAMALAAASPAFAAEAKIKIIAENDKLQVMDVVQNPGDTGAMESRLGVVVHWITGGTVERSFADGSKQVMTRKDGETTLINEKRPYGVKNIGKTVTHLIEIKLK
jgi:hypothetical protein